MVLKIVDVKSSVLRKEAKEVSKLDKKILKLISDMKDTLVAQKDPEGIGLAAPQVGKSLQLFLARYKGFERVVINPKVISIEKLKKSKIKTKKRKEILEGCLSLPHYYGPIKRPDKLTLSYVTPKTDSGKVSLSSVTEEFKGFRAQIIQHELDHLNGVLFIDHILTQGSPLYKFQGAEWEEVELI